MPSKKSDKISQSRILSSMSHDLKNPLHGILSYANFGIKKTSTEQISKEKTLHYFNSIKDAGIRLQSLLDDIIEFAKLDIEPINVDIKRRNLDTIVQSVISEIQNKYSDDAIQYSISAPNKSISAGVDVKYFSKALRHLVVGIVDYVKKSVNIEISIEPIKNKSVSKVTISCPQLQIEQSQLDIISSFVTHIDHTDPSLKSFGIKYAIAQQIIQAHQGTLSSIENENCVTFEISIP